MGIKKIISSETDLNTNRYKEIKKIIKKISANSSIHPKRVASNAGAKKIIFCVSDSSQIFDTSQFSNLGDIKERFKTKNKNYSASYYEIWNKKENSKQDYILNRIYFHLYKTEDDSEYVLLHTDPDEEDAKHGDYKRSPHLHIKNKNDSFLSRVHFALNITDYDQVFSTRQELNNCMEEHIAMLSHQILELY